MMRRVLFFAASFAVLGCVGFAAATGLEMEEEAVPILTEAEIKRMKVRDLTVFLADRGQQCTDCQEKNDFVKLALAHRETPILPSKRKLKPKGEFWENWAALARQTCEEGAAKKTGVKAATICGSIGSAIDSMFMQQGKRAATRLKKKPAALLKTSFTEPYLGAGRKMLAKLVAHCLSSGKVCHSTSRVQELIEKDNSIKGVRLSDWITNVGIENTNPMFEALKDKSLNADL
jgi:hypothetical protein